MVMEGLFDVLIPDWRMCHASSRCCSSRFVLKTPPRQEKKQHVMGVTAVFGTESSVIEMAFIVPLTRSFLEKNNIGVVQSTRIIHLHPLPYY